MATYDISLNVVTAAAAQTTFQPVGIAVADTTNSTGQPQTQSAPGSGSASGSQQSSAEVEQKIQNALKNTGVKAEIEMEHGMGMIVRLVHADTGQLLVQLPPQAVLDLVAQVTSEMDLEESKRFGSPNYSGQHIDQVA
jgi:uncharacterized FlaG/YvyC family protein